MWHHRPACVCLQTKMAESVSEVELVNFFLTSCFSSDSEDIEVESNSTEVESDVMKSESDSDEENMILLQLLSDAAAIRAVIELYRNKLYKRPTITNYLDVVHNYSDHHVNCIIIK